MLKRQGRCVAVYAVTAAAVGFLFGFNAGPAAPGPSSSALRAVAAESTIPDGWDADAALTSTGFKCSAGRGRPWAIVHDADYDLRTLRVTEKWLPNHKRVLPVLLSRGWSVVRVGMPGIAAGHHVASALDDACSGARERCLALDCDLLARLPFTQPTCGASCAAQPSASLSAARNAAALLAVACGASHVLEASSSMLSSGTLSDAELLDPTAAAWAAGAPSWRARMAGAGNVKVMAADEPASGGFVHVLAHLGEPILFSRGLPGARIPNVTMSVMDLRAPMGEQAPFVPIHVFVPDGTPDASAAARAARQGYFPRKPQQDYSTRRDKHWLFPGSVTPYGQETLVRTLNPGSVAPYGALATLYSREALWALFLRPGSCRAAEGIWGAEALRSLVTEAILHMAGSTVAWVGGRQGFYRPVAPVTDLEILAEAAADLTIERVAAALVTAVRAALLEGPRFEARSLPAAFDYVLGVLERAKVLPAEATGGLRRWATDLKRLGYELDGMFARAGTAGAGAPFLTPMTVCSAEPNRTEPPTHRVRAAMCINGEAQYYDSAIASIHTLRPYFPDDNREGLGAGVSWVEPNCVSNVLLAWL